MGSRPVPEQRNLFQLPHDLHLPPRTASDRNKANLICESPLGPNGRILAASGILRSRSHPRAAALGA